jgi:hypothetical protein
MTTRIYFTAILRASSLLIAAFPVHVHRSQQNIGCGGIGVLGVLLYKRHCHTCNLGNARVIRYALVEPERCLCDGANKKIALIAFLPAIREPFASGIIRIPRLNDATILRVRKVTGDCEYGND